MTYATQSIARRLPDDLKEFACTIETEMLETFRTLDSLTASTFDAYCKRAVRRGRKGLERMRAEFVAEGLQAAGA